MLPAASFNYSEQGIASMYDSDKDAPKTLGEYFTIFKE
jgi:hypothetical protein